ncbi:MAG TPA: glycosyltransferase family 39 protein [Gemmatimonadaceae bacterium]
MRRILNPRWAAAACGVTSFLFVWWLWGSLNQVAVVHDEAAYLLQARIFASGHVVAAARPAPEFFEQYHTFVDPVVAAKYPPGFSLFLVPGIWLGMPGLVPALLVGASTALAFLLATGLASAPVAFVTVVLMNASSVAIKFNPSYSSEVLTSFLVLLSWLALYRHWTTGRVRWLLLLSAAVGWGAITRPFTMLAFAIPTGVATLISIRRHRAWLAIVPSVAIVAAAIGILLVFNRQVTGSWRKSAQMEYARMYIPEDHVGFGVTGATPARALSAEQQKFNAWVDSMHVEHTTANLPAAIRWRARTFIHSTWARANRAAWLAVLGLALLPLGVGVLVASTVLGIFAAYFLYAYPPTWTAYYLELQPPLAFLAAAGAFFAVRTIVRFAAPTLSRRISSRGLGPAAPPDARKQRLQTQLLFAIVALWLVFPTPAIVSVGRRMALTKAEYWQNFRELVSTLPTKRAVVFVQYGRGHLMHSSLVQNEPFESADVWIVHDRGADDARLMRFAGDRSPYLYSETLNGSKAVGHIAPMTLDNLANVGR